MDTNEYIAMRDRWFPLDATNSFAEGENSGAAEIQWSMLGPAIGFLVAYIVVQVFASRKMLKTASKEQASQGRQLVRRMSQSFNTSNLPSVACAGAVTPIEDGAQNPVA